MSTCTSIKSGPMTTQSGGLLAMLVFVGVVSLGGLAACHASGGEGNEDSSSADALSGDIRTEKRCAIRDTYLRASLADFTFVPASEAFSNPPEGVTDVGILPVRGVGSVIVVQTQSLQTDFRDGGITTEVGAPFIGFYEGVEAASPTIVAQALTVGGALEFYALDRGTSVFRRADGTLEPFVDSFQSPLVCPNARPVGDPPAVGSALRDGGGAG